VTPGQRLWASKLAGACCSVGAVSKDGTVFVSADVKAHFETVAYSGATGARLWAKAYQGREFNFPRAITVSPDGSRVYVTGSLSGGKAADAVATIAYDARTGRQLWVSQFRPKDGADVRSVAVSPDGTSLYVAGYGRVSGSPWQFSVLAYAAATGKQRWQRYYPTPGQYGSAGSVAVSPDGQTIYATGGAGTTAVTVAYRAAGTLKWAARYSSPYKGFAEGDQIVVAPSGSAVYVGGRESAPNKHVDIATLAYSAATGKRLWREQTLGGVPDIAVTPNGQSVIVDGSQNYTHIEMDAYNAATGATQWSRLAPGTNLIPDGLVISPSGSTLYIGGNDTMAFSVANGAVLWTSGGAWGSAVFGLSGSEARVFGTRTTSVGITTFAYQT
jgi:DNA-binding beta-propeller fold protein YncE